MPDDDDVFSPPTASLALSDHDLTVEKLFRDLSFGDLSGTNMGNNGSGSVDEENYPKIIKAANEALLKLYGKFILKENDVLVEQKAHITNYHLRYKFAETANTDVPYKYIKDLPGEPFLDDVIRILAVYRADGQRYPLNDSGKINSLFTPSPTVLQVPRPLEGMAMSVHYQASHVPLADGRDGRGITGDEVLAQQLEVPPVLYSVFQYYIASKVFLNMGGQDNSKRAADLLSLYEQGCQDITANDLMSQSISTDVDKFDQRGFV